MSLMAKLKGQWRGDVDDIRDAIIENLSAVLSARAPMWQNTELSPQVRDSIAAFGMVSSLRSQGKSSSDVILHDVKQLIVQFEPRLKEVVVELDENSVATNKLKFRIEGLISSKFSEEVVVFDSSLDFTTSSLDVRKTNLV
ncbi:type VI secretion system baseplate subunit TssE [Photobacterium chitinilyticum]|uniref:Type VI secretion system baseplate subunit TssE n=1 Tax=Photobacterium chitinilyticum TaxID=2485123 RepID=A0A444JTD2_9GAMM|nr:type VI secretion system baseplate subunit TssE [Photobacterium chitinilyticum]RWX56313.1 type VI secretion system baseplate subunit TssE [Photobacterium chitinilyticum]